MLPGKSIGPALIVQMLRRRAWLIALPTLVTFFGALVYSSTLPNLYQSDMLIAVDPQRVPDSFVRSTVTVGTDRRLEALKVSVMSRTALEEFIERFDLYPAQRLVMPKEDVVGMFRSDIGMVVQTPRPRWGENPQPTAFRIQFTYWEPEKARQVTQELGALFVAQNASDRGAQAGATNRFLESQLVESRHKLEEHEQRLEAFRQRHGRELPTQMQSNLQALATVQGRAQNIVDSSARDRDRKLMLERLYREAAAERPADPVGVAAERSTGSETPSASSLQQQLANARSSLSALELRYAPSHPDVLRAKRLIAELEPRAAAEVTAAAEATPTSDPASLGTAPSDAARRESLRQMLAEIESLDRQIAFKETEEQKARTEIAEYQRRLEAVPGLESEWVALTRDYDTQQSVYKELLSKSTAAQLAANLEDQEISERFRIVDPAVVPVRPLPSERIRLNAIGLGVGLLIGLIVAGMLEVMDKSFRSEGDVLDVLSLPVLATVPYVETSVEKISRKRRRLAVSMGGAACVLVASYVVWTLRLWNSLI